MADEKIETVEIVQAAGPHGSVILERKVTVEIVKADPALTGLYL